MLPPAWSAPVHDYLTWMQAAGAAAGTLRLRAHYLGRLALAVDDPWTATLDQLVGFLATAGWKPETRRSARAAVRDFYKWAHIAGRVESNPALMLPTVAVPNGRPRPTPEQVVSIALARADERERLMLMLMAYAGLRCAETARVHSDDIGIGELRVTGKGGKVRIVPLHPALAAAIEPHRGQGYLFPSPRGGHLTAGRVGALVKRKLGDSYSAHTLRHRFASRAYAGTHDLRAVQTLLGHSKPETTARYTAVPDDSLRAAVDCVA